MVAVITIKDGVVDEAFVYTQGGDASATRAEEQFASLVRSLDTVDDEAMEAFLDDGYYQKANWAVCIVWPMVRA